MKTSAPLKLSLRELDEQTYDDFVKKQSTLTFLQSVQLYRRYQIEHREAYLLGGYQGEKLLAVALCTKKYARLGQKIFNIPRGPILDYKASNSTEILTAFLAQIEKFLRTKNGMAVQISPNVYRKVSLKESEDKTKKPDISDLLREDWPKPSQNLSVSLKKHGYKDLGEFEQIKWAYFLNVKNRSEDELLMSFRYDCRRSIKQNADRYHISLRELDTSDLKPFRQLIEQTGARRGFSNPNPSYFENMKAVFQDDVHFVLAELHDGDKVIPVATGMFIYSGDEVVYLYSGSDPAYNKMNPPILVIWKMIQLAREKGCTYFNFYGTHPLPIFADSSVFNFKQNFRGEIVEYVGTFIKPLTLAGRLYLSRLNYAEFRLVA